MNAEPRAGCRYAVGMEFNAPWSETLRLMSLGAAGVIILAVVLATVKHPWWIRLTAMVVAAAFLLGSWGFAPAGYRVDSARVTIKRLMSDVVIARQAIRAVRLFEDADGEGMSRTAGNGGLFGYYGKYKSDKLGSHVWYVTDMSKRVVLETTDGVVVVSPDDPEMFIQALKPSE